MNKRHGDIAFIKTEVDTTGMKLISKNNSCVLAEGEATNHYHTITAVKGTCEVYQDKKGMMIVKVDGRALLTHPEHKTLEFPTGIWKVDREQEYDYFALKTHKVID
jgi:RNase P/RNase MRP subunit p29